MAKTDILIVVDMQNDFIDGTLGSKEAQAIVENVRQKIIDAEKSGAEILFTQDTHSENYMDTEEGKNLPVKHCIKNTDGWNISDRIWSEDVLSDAYVFEKGTFGSGELYKHLKVHYYDPVIEVVGLCTDICVLSNVVRAKTALPNAHIIVDAACCAGVTPESHDTALNAMKAIQIEVINQGREPWRELGVNLDAGGTDRDVDVEEEVEL